MSGLVDRLRAAGCVFAEDEARLLADTFSGAELERAVVRRVHGEPLEQILGFAQFGELRVRLLPGVFVPRQRSLVLVDAAMAGLPATATALDLCCGSGALGALVAARAPSATVYAADVDPVAVRCARLNLPADRVFEGDLFGAVPQALRGRLDVVLAHAPYVPTGRIALMPPEARDHEHRVALDGGPDGLDLLRRVLHDVPSWLEPGGRVLFECAPAQREEACDLAVGAGLAAEVVVDDEVGALVVVGSNPRL